MLLNPWQIRSTLSTELKLVAIEEIGAAGDAIQLFASVLFDEKLLRWLLRRRHKYRPHCNVSALSVMLYPPHAAIANLLSSTAVAAAALAARSACAASAFAFAASCVPFAFASAFAFAVSIVAAGFAAGFFFFCAETAPARARTARTVINFLMLSPIVMSCRYCLLFQKNACRLIPCTHKISELQH
jgi:hypothetical protein